MNATTTATTAAAARVALQTRDTAAVPVDFPHVGLRAK